MANWNTRGYVPDSDDEDELDAFPQARSVTWQCTRDNEITLGAVEGNDAQESSVPTDHDTGIDVTAHKLQASLQHGLQLIGEALGQTPPTVSHDDVVDDSPLSSLASTPRSTRSCTKTVDERTPAAPNDNAVIVNIPPTTTQQVYQRTLRHRKAIQQNPYSLEDARYRQQWKDSGLKPINFVRHSSLILGQSNDESQQSDVLASSQTETPFSQDSAALGGEGDHQQDSLLAEIDPYGAGNDFDDWDLPDLDELIANPTQSAKRKNLMTATHHLEDDEVSRPAYTKLIIPQLPREKNKHPMPRTKTTPRQQSSIPSPPRSTSVVSSDHLPSVHVEDSTDIPSILPTPVVSSEVRSRKRRVIHDDDSDPQSAIELSGRVAEFTELSSSSSGEDESQEIHLAAKRTKGVLPASWLRFDQAKQKAQQTKSKMKQAQSPKQDKGIAVRKIGRSHSRTISFFDLDSSTSDTDSQEIQPRHLTSLDLYDLGQARPDDGLDNDAKMLDIEEDNGIDYMLPARDPAKVRKSREQKSLDGHLGSGTNDGRRPAITSAPSRDGKGRGTSGRREIHVRKRRKRVHVRSRVSVLDAPGIRSPGDTSPPRFLKLVARTVRKRQRPQGVDTTRKYFSMAHAEDDEDISHAFDDLKEQQLAPKREKSYGSTRTESKSSHLAAGIRNETPNLGNNGNDFFNLRTATEAVLRRNVRPVRGEEHKIPSTRGSNLNTGGQSLHLTRLRTLLPLTNRSGRGTFVSRTPVARPAQLESPASITGHRQDLTSRQEELVTRLISRPQPYRDDAIKLRTPAQDKQPRGHRLRKQVPQRRRPVSDRAQVAHGQHDEAQVLEKPDMLLPSVDIQNDEMIMAVKRVESLRRLVPRAASAWQDDESLFSRLRQVRQLHARIAGSVTSDLLDFDGQHVRIQNLKTGDTRYYMTWEQSLSKVFMDNLEVSRQALISMATEGGSDVSINEILEACAGMIEMIDRHAANFSVSNIKTLTELVIAHVDAVTRSLERTEAEVLEGSSLEELLIQHLHMLTQVLTIQAGRRQRLDANGSASLCEELFSDDTHARELLCHSLRICVRSLQHSCSFSTLVDGAGAARHAQKSNTWEGIALTLFGLSLFPASSGQLDLLLWQALLPDTIKAVASPAREVVELVERIVLVTAMSFKMHRHQVPLLSRNIHEPIYDSMLAMLNQISPRSKNLSSDVQAHNEQLRLAIYLFLAELWLECKYDPSPKILSLWFRDCQKAWFHNEEVHSLKVSIRKDTTFHIFMQNLTCHLDVPRESKEMEQRQLRSFLFGLVPNRSQIGHRGQVGDKMEALRLNDVRLIRNLFDLLVMMIEKAPKCAPRVKTLQSKVDFSSAHPAVCEIALQAWDRLMSRPISLDETGKDLASWQESMISQAIARWHAAEVEVRSEAQRSAATLSESTISEVIQANQQEAGEVISSLIEATRQHIATYFRIEGASRQLGVSLLLSIFRVAQAQPRLSDAIVHASITLIQANAGGLCNGKGHQNDLPRLLEESKAIMSLHLEGPLVVKSVLIGIVNVYSLLAAASIKARQKFWDDFLEPSSRYSLDMLLHARHLRDARSIFYVHMLEGDPRHYKFECRALVLTHWIQTMLLTDGAEEPLALLTNTIFSVEKESLLLAEVSQRFALPEGGFDIISLQRDLSTVRAIVIKHVLRKLYSQFDDPEADTLVGGLERSDARNLLSVIFQTMKDHWTMLDEDLLRQESYEHFMDSVLLEYEAHPREDYQLDPWFYNTLGTTIRRKHTLSGAFRSRGDRATILHDAMNIFQHDLAQAIRQERLDEFVNALQVLLLPTDLDFVDEEPKLTTFLVDLLAQAEFVEQIFPRYIAAASTNETSLRVAVALCSTLCYVLNNLELRIDALASNTVISMLSAAQTVITPIRQLFCDTSTIFDVGFELARVTFEWHARLPDLQIEEELANRFFRNIEALCDVAALDDGEPALMLLQAVIHAG